MNQISVADRLLNVGFASIAVIVANYVVYSLILSAAYNGYFGGQILFVSMVEFMLAVAAVLLYSWRCYWRAFEKKEWGQPTMRAWKFLRFGLNGLSFVIVGIALALIWRGSTNVFLLGSFAAAEVLIVGVLMEFTYTIRIIEIRGLL